MLILIIINYFLDTMIRHWKTVPNVCTDQHKDHHWTAQIIWSEVQHCCVKNVPLLIQHVHQLFLAMHSFRPIPVLLTYNFALSWNLTNQFLRIMDSLLITTLIITTDTIQMLKWTNSKKEAKCLYRHYLMLHLRVIKVLLRTVRAQVLSI